MSVYLTASQRVRPRRATPGVCSRGIKLLVTTLFLLAELCRGTAALAQGPSGFAGGLDLEPPLIEHEIVSEADASFRQRFFAQVVDDRELASVTLHWRYAGEGNYARVAMNRVSTSSTWVGEVSTSPADARAIEYFLEARDVGGNRTVRGFVFSPLVRRIVNPDRPAAPAAERTADAQAPEASRSRTIYWVLGALAVGVLAGLASGGSSGGNDNGECGNDGCEVVILFEPPVSP